MAPVLSFIHVVIVHINFHHPSYARYYKAYNHRRDRESRAIHPTELSRCQLHCIIVNFILSTTGQGCKPRLLSTHSTPRNNCKLCFDWLKSLQASWKKTEQLHINAPNPLKDRIMEQEKRVTATNMGSCPAAAACGSATGFLNKLRISINMQLRQVSTATSCVAIGFLIAQRYGKRGSQCKASAR